MKNQNTPRITLLLALLTLACGTITESDAPTELRPCDPSFGSDSSTGTDAESSSSSSSDGSSSDETSTTGTEIVCPTIVNGDVDFDLPDAGVTRTVYFVNVDDASGLGPLFTYFPGTFESPEAVLPWSPIDSDPAWGPRQGLRPMAEAENGVLAIVRADPDAVARANNPYPYWPVCDPIYLEDPSYGCDRHDDYELAEAVATCVVAQGLAAADRLSVGGMSAGGIFVSSLVEDPAGAMFAAAISWSGGEPLANQPTVRSGSTSTMVLHGGESDVYCAPFMSTGCYSFVQPSEQFAEDTSAVIACNHGAGHSATIAGASSEFMARARLGQQHPWQGFPVGAGGWASFPEISDGAMWVLRNDCDPF